MADLNIKTNPRFQKQGLPDAVKLGNLQNLLQDALVASGHVEKAALVSCSDGSVITATVGFRIDSEKAKVFLDVFKSVKSLNRQRCLIYNKEEFELIRADTSSVYAKHEKSGIIAAKTDSLIVIGFYTDNMYASVAVEAVEKLADYLRQKGK